MSDERHGSDRVTRHKPEYYLPQVYAFLRENGPSNSSEIGDAIGMSSSGASSMLRKLVERKLLHRDSDGRGSHPRYDVQPFEKFTRQEPEPVVLLSTEPLESAAKQELPSSDQDERIAEAANLLFEIDSADLLLWIRWIALTKELMNNLTDEG